MQKEDWLCTFLSQTFGFINQGGLSSSSLQQRAIDSLMLFSRVELQCFASPKMTSQLCFISLDKFSSLPLPETLQFCEDNSLWGGYFFF
jgi:hypothetical protein